MTQEHYTTISVRAVIRDGDRVLVEWFAPKSISFLPGGTVEDGEDLCVALERELAEELDGVRIEVQRYLGEIGHRWTTAKGCDSCLNHFYEARIISGSQPKARETGRTIKWLSLTSKGELATLQPPKLRELLSTRSDSRWKYIDSKL